MEDYIAFNKALKHFVRCSIEAFPDFKELKVLLITYKMLKTINKKQPCKLFLAMTSNCQDAILAKDEQYFIENGLYCPENSIQSLSAAFKEKWFALDSTNKDVIWQHLQVLVLLSRKCQKIDNA
jgi:hypothetical protein